MFAGVDIAVGDSLLLLYVAREYVVAPCHYAALYLHTVGITLVLAVRVQ